MLKHIRDNVREVGKKSFWATDDPNVVVVLTTASEEIHTDQLDREIEELERQVQDLPDVATVVIDNAAVKEELSRRLAALRDIKNQSRG